MAQKDDRVRESETPRPHGDPLDPAAVEPNPAQRQTDAPPDVVGSDIVEDAIESGSTANGVPSYDSTDDERRRKLYKNTGAPLVSRID
jgi:hypothetical protein